MTTRPNITAEPQLIARAKGILLQPRLEWPKIASEAANVGSLYTGYIIPLAGLAVLCGFIRNLLGVTVLGVTYRPTVWESVSAAVWQLAAQLAGVFIIALIVETLAPYFGGSKDRVGALKLVAYSMTAAWLSNVFLLIPGLGFLTVLGLYSVYLIIMGAPILLNIPSERALSFTASLFPIGIVMSLIFFAFIAPMLHYGSGSPTAPRAAATEEGAPEANSAISIPGVGKVDLSKLNELGRRLDALSTGDGQLPVIATADLAQLMPIDLPGFARTETSTSQNSAGLDLASVSAVYANGDNVITLSISDMGVAGTLASLPGAIGFNRTEQTNGTYSKLATIDGRMTMEDFDPAAKIGSYGKLIAERVMVKAEGHGVSVEQLKAAVNAVDAAAIEALAAH